LLEATVGSETPAGTREQWYALWTRSHAERLVHDQLAARGFRLFLPTVNAWSRRGGARHLVSLPMFPGYLFLRHTMDKPAHVEVRKARGLVRVLGIGWDRLTPVPDAQIDAIQSILGANLPVMPHAFLRVGQRVRVARGPLTDLEGILVRTQPDKGLLVISVDLLRQSVAVVVDCTDVVPISLS
jgi:transcription antitermination factor NusG